LRIVCHHISAEKKILDIDLELESEEIASKLPKRKSYFKKEQLQESDNSGMYNSLKNLPFRSSNKTKSWNTKIS
jgi:hypothetical protein